MLHVKIWDFVSSEDNSLFLQCKYFNELDKLWYFIDLIFRNGYKKFSYFLIGIFLKLSKSIIAIYYSILRKNIFKFFYVLVFIYSATYGTGISDIVSEDLRNMKW